LEEKNVAIWVENWGIQGKIVANRGEIRCVVKKSEKKFDAK